jgi:hypothetical protein
MTVCPLNNEPRMPHYEIRGLLILGLRLSGIAFAKVPLRAFLASVGGFTCNLLHCARKFATLEIRQ